MHLWKTTFLALLALSVTASAQEGIYEDPLPLGQLLHSEEAHIKADDATIIGDTMFTGRLHIHDGTSAAQWANGDTTPDVKGASFFETGTTAVTVTDFDWSGGTPTEFGQVIYVRSMGKTTFDCSGNLHCGMGNIGTESGGATLWISIERDGGGATYWRLLSYTNVDQSYSDVFLKELNPFTFGTTQLSDTKLYGYLDLGFHEYFMETDTTPTVQQGTLFYSWECNDSYNTHCTDQYSLRFAFLFALEGFIDSYSQVVAWLGGSNNALGSGKGYPGFKSSYLRHRPGFD